VYIVWTLTRDAVGRVYREARHKNSRAHMKAEPGERGRTVHSMYTPAQIFLETPWPLVRRPATFRT
jgi:hypothetical protein